LVKNDGLPVVHPLPTLPEKWNIGAVPVQSQNNKGNGKYYHAQLPKFHHAQLPK